MTNMAWARFADSLGSALRDLAEDLRAQKGDEAPVLAEQPIHDPERGKVLGPRQKAILQLSGMSQPVGMKTSDIAREINYEVPNTYMTLQGLQRNGFVEMIVGITPQTWRLTPRYRATAEPYLKAATYVYAGEWTTYGDISLVARGDTSAARAVGRAAATLDNFPNPHRLLLEGGVIPDGWRARSGAGPEECRRRLEAEGVFFANGRADPSKRVTWDILRERLDQAA